MDLNKCINLTYLKCLNASQNDNTTNSEGSDIDWNTDDDLEIENASFSSCSTKQLVGDPGASTSAGNTSTSTSGLITHFMGMGFPRDFITRALKRDVVQPRESKVAFDKSSTSAKDSTTTCWSGQCLVFYKRFASMIAQEIKAKLARTATESINKPVHQSTNDTSLSHASPTEGLSEGDSETESRNEESLRNNDIETNQREVDG
ncbi:unnamed protein product [Fraxinus pennsylvanica]|uniref:Uncharacterized protein n=1 Tax=Fraxinus pennsylvanica TaxID=56036 RepID=A0AAD1Z5Q6_9LAMI|nr:unnamed protein product [Fraxinus pennsylvanica]